MEKSLLNYIYLKRENNMSEKIKWTTDLRILKKYFMGGKNSFYKNDWEADTHLTYDKRWTLKDLEELKNYIKSIIELSNDDDEPLIFCNGLYRLEISNEKNLTILAKRLIKELKEIYKKQDEEKRENNKIIYNCKCHLETITTSNINIVRGCLIENPDNNEIAFEKYYHNEYINDLVSAKRAIGDKIRLSNKLKHNVCKEKNCKGKGLKYKNNYYQLVVSNHNDLNILANEINEIVKKINYCIHRSLPLTFFGI